ncbi:MAG: IS66 family transposase [Candidatus Eisenbacteria bacterium]|uniref:IS66 family transposase n=1 Tax=Eiseniibacteriota bacterium TaxID=2212470 RepID=A0A948W7J6_UNCEI|nr:IS66 family transposase [Candidatus Eisenbacteria bacterium]MBU1947536.1 IS66 family transposase [Candidatus Eisenbacteria bacterium]MBU2691706.1 IS66 family transposase [Candidatus Eisenbacteria bacterium]
MMNVILTPEEIIRTLQAENESLKEALDKLERQNKSLSEEIRVLLHRMFRKKSERLDPDQLRMFEEALLGTSESVSEAEEVEEKRVSVRKRHKGHGRTSFPAHLPREVIELPLSPEDRQCSDCGREMKEIGVETTERGHIIPARLVVKQYVRKKYACPVGHGVRTPELPPSLIEKCKYEPSVYAHLAVAKYGDHQPLHRLSGIYKRQGFSLPKSTMWEMLRRVSELVAEAVLDQMRKELLTERLLQADETPVTVRLEDRKGSHKGYIWCYGIGKKRIFKFTMSRGRDGPSGFLRGWKRGTLQSDGYSGYDEVTRTENLKRAGCWSHARRKVVEAADAGTPKAVLLLRPIQRLFWIERAVKRRSERLALEHGAFLDLRQDVRGRLSRIVLKRIRKRVKELRAERSTLPKSPLGKALTYLYNQWRPLRLFLRDPELEIHNNDSERAIRHIVIGRKNWLFFGSPEGAKVGANLFSLVATCKTLGINPESYLEDILQKVDTTPMSEIARLTPWAWAEEMGREPNPPVNN